MQADKPRSKGAQAPLGPEAAAAAASAEAAAVAAAAQAKAVEAAKAVWEASTPAERARMLVGGRRGKRWYSQPFTGPYHACWLHASWLQLL